MSIATDIKKEYEAQIKEAGFFDYYTRQYRSCDARSNWISKK